MVFFYYYYGVGIGELSKIFGQKTQGKLTYCCQVLMKAKKQIEVYKRRGNVK